MDMNYYKEENDYYNFLREDIKEELNSLCSSSDINILKFKYNIHNTYQLIGKCMELYENEDIQNFRKKLIDYFFELEERNKIIFLISEKISILFLHFYDENNLFETEKITIKNKLLSEFLRLKLSGDLKEVPYISKKYETILKKNNIKTSFCLIGKYLSLGNVDDFFKFLKKIGIHLNINNIIHCIGEKSNLIFPGSYEIYEEIS